MKAQELVMSMSSTFMTGSGEGYELLMGRWSRRLAAPFIDFVGLSGKPRILDVGCGTGVLAAELAHRMDFAELRAVDICGPYVAYARDGCDDPRVRFEVADACNLPFPQPRFDAVLSLLLLHHVPDHPRAISEMKRVAAPGAVVAAAVWDIRGGFVSNRLFFDTAAAIFPDANAIRAKNFTRPLTRPGELRTAWLAAGFSEVEERSLCIRMEFSSFEDYWAPCLGRDGPQAEYVGRLSPDERLKLEAAVRAAYLDGEENGPRSFAALAWAVKGRVPSDA